MGIKIYNHNLFNHQSSLQVVNSQRYIRVNAKTASFIPTGMMESSREVHCPSHIYCQASCENGSFSSQKHGIKYFPSQQPSRQKPIRELNIFTNLNSIAQFYQIRLVHFLQEKSSTRFIRAHYVLRAYYFLEKQFFVNCEVFLGIKWMKLLQSPKLDIVSRMIYKSASFVAQISYFLGSISGNHIVTILQDKWVYPYPQQRDYTNHPFQAKYSCSHDSKPQEIAESIDYPVHYMMDQYQGYGIIATHQISYLQIHNYSCYHPIQNCLLFFCFVFCCLNILKCNKNST